MSSKNFYGLTGDVTVDGGILNVGNAQLYANTETSNVGIGTSNPEFELDVHGNANVGVLYSTFLHGDGSNIQNIVSSQWEGSLGDPIYYASNVGIANTSPVTATLQIGSNVVVDDVGSNVMHVTGNIYADYLVGDGSQLTGIAASLDQIVDQGNTVSNTIQIVSGQDASSNVGLVTHDDVGISVSNTNPTGAFQFGVGSNLLVNVYSSNVLTVDGNVLAQKMTLGTVTVTPAYNLQQITTKGATTSQTLILENATTGLTTTSNVGIANTAPVHTLDVGSNLYVEDTGSNVLTVTGNVSVSGDLNVGSNLSVEDTGSNVLSVTGNVSVSNRLDVGSNLHIENLRVAEVASNLVTYDSTTGEIMDSGGLFSNKLAVVSEQPPIALTGASTLVTNHGTYTIEASSGTVVNLFDKNESTKWVTDGNYSTTVDTKGTYGGSASLAGHGGEWVKITMPYKTILRHIKIESTNQSVEDIELVGLNADGLTWTPLKTETGLTGPTHTIIVNATTHHRTYGLIVEKTNTTTGRSAVEIEDLKLFTESFSIDGGKVEMASSAVMGGETTMDQHGPHSRDPTTPLLKKFPEIVFDASKYDQNHSTNTYVQAGYTVTASSQATDEKIAAKLYNDQFPININTDDGWQSQINTYNGSTGVATSLNTLTGITGATSSRNGSYTTLELPHKIKLSYLQIHTRNSVDHGTPVHPKQVYVYGSNDGSSWTQVGSHLFTSVPSSPIWQRIDINSTTPYKYFVLQTTSILPFLDTSLNRVYILDLEWYGYEEDPPQGDLSLDTTLKSTFNSVRSNNYVMYFDGKDPDGTDPKNLVSGSSISLTNNNATYEASNDYGTLDGSTESNVTTGSLGFEGDVPHTVSMWVNASNLDANALTQQLFSIGSGYDKALVRVDDTQIAANTWHNVTYAYQGEGGSKVTYVDGRKVEEAQVEDTFGEYPPFAMTDYETGGYRVSASDTFNEYFPYLAFNRLVNTQSDYWFAGDDIGGAGIDAYTGSVGGDHSYIGSDNLGGYTGIWIKLEMPHKLALSYIEFYRVNNLMIYTPRDFYVIGSNDDITWDLIHRETSTAADSTFTSGRPITTTSANNYNKYKYIAIVVDRTVNDNRLGIGELRLYGHRENDLVRLPDPTNVLKYPHITLDTSNGIGMYNNPAAKRGYVVTASTYGAADREPVLAFDGDTSTLWYGGFFTDSGGAEGSSPNQFFLADGSGQTVTDASSTVHYGSWLTLELPHKLQVSSIKIRSTGNSNDARRRFKGGKLFGSNTHNPTSGTISGNYYQLGSRFDFATSSTDEATFTINATTAYKYITLLGDSCWYNGTNDEKHFYIHDYQIFGTEENSSIPIQIGGGNIDKVANFRVYDKFVGEDQALAIWDAQKDEIGRAKSSMTLHKGYLGIGTTEPEGRLAVLDEPDPGAYGLQEYPPKPLAGYKTHIEGHGEFCVKVSSNNANFEGWKAFNKIFTGAEGWMSEDNPDTYTQGTGLPNSTTAVFNGKQGEWLHIELPYKISLKKTTILQRTSSDHPRPTGSFTIWGSNDTIHWDEIITGTHTRTVAVNETTGDPINRDIDTSKFYSSYVFQVHSIIVTSGNDDTCHVAEWKLFGYREQSPPKQSVLHDGQLTLTKSLTVPRIGPALDADDTPRRDRLVVEYNTSTNPTFEGAVRDTSGKGNDGVFYGGASYNATEKALVFDGTDDYIRSGILTNMSGDKAVSYSLWIKADAVVSTMIVALVEAGVYTTSQTVGIYMDTTGTLYNTVFGNGIQVTGAIVQGSWIHIVATKVPGGSGIATQALYINGVKPTQSNWGTAGTSLSLNNPVITLGASPTINQRFNGSISNFKLYDTALTAQEVKTLYDMGRCSNAIPKTLHIMGGMMRYNNDIGKLQIHNGDRWSTIGGTRASGGTRLTFGDYALHVFTESGTFSMEHSGYVDILIVAGGGSGGNVSNGGGGGAGGLRLAQDYLLNGGSYTVTVGAGGAECSSGAGNDGSASSFGTISTQGGGGGGDYGQSGRNGGSGGGGGAYIGSTSGGSGQQSDTSDGLFIGYGNN